jgi:hypothetical protein
MNSSDIQTLIAHFPVDIESDPPHLFSCKKGGCHE